MSIVREIYCEDCGDFGPLDDEGGPHKDEVNPYPWHDLVCGTCRLIVATIRVRGEASALDGPGFCPYCRSTRSSWDDGTRVCEGCGAEFPEEEA